MSVVVKIRLPRQIYDILQKKSIEEKTTIEEILIRAIVKVIEEDKG